MSEDKDSKIINEDEPSAGDIFNNLVKSIIEEKKRPKVGVVVNNADEQILVQNWLASKHTQDFLSEANKGKYTFIGIVHKVNTDAWDQINVGLINKWGFFGFVYEKGAERFKEAPNGFQVGDIVLQKMDGTTILSAKPLNLSLKATLSVVDKIRGDHDKIENPSPV